MARFTEEELKERSFYRVSWVLWHFWEEQQDDQNVKRAFIAGCLTHSFMLH